MPCKTKPWPARIQPSDIWDVPRCGRAAEDRRSLASASPAVTPGASATGWFVYTQCPSPQARSYKKEIIHACIAGGDTWRIGLNFIFNMRDLGYDHWVIYVPREQQCSELEAALRGVGTIGQHVCTTPLKLTSLFLCLHHAHRNSIWQGRWLHG